MSIRCRLFHVIDDQDTDRPLIGRKLQSYLLLEGDKEVWPRVRGRRWITGIGCVTRISSAAVRDSLGAHVGVGRELQVEIELAWNARLVDDRAVQASREPLCELRHG